MYCCATCVANSSCRHLLSVWALGWLALTRAVASAAVHANPIPQPHEPFPGLTMYIVSAEHASELEPPGYKHGRNHSKPLRRYQKRVTVGARSDPCSAPPCAAGRRRHVTRLACAECSCKPRCREHYVRGGREEGGQHTNAYMQTGEYPNTQRVCL